MTRTVIDYDSFRKEQQHEPIDFVIGGKTYEKASSLPATVAIDVLALQSQDEDAEVPLELLETVGAACFGAAEWKQLLTDNQVSMVEIPDLVQAMLTAYAPVDEDDPEDPQPAST